MSALYDVLIARLEKLRPVAGGGWQSRCPACAVDNNGDKMGNHLRVYPHGAFNCAKIGASDGGLHNKIIRTWIYEGSDPLAIAALTVDSLEDPNPKIDTDTVYPDEMLQKLIPDHRYWLNRGISEGVLRRLEGGLVPSDPPSKLSGYYTFPVRDPDTGRIIGWWSRLVNEASFGPKHKHLVRTSRAIYPYAIASPEIKRTRRLLLTEGGGDALTWATYGLWNWFILFGLNLNSRILGRLVALNPDEIIISTNNDALTINPKTGKPKDEGNVAAEKVRAKLVPYFGENKVRIRLPQTRKDWNATHMDGTGEMEVFIKELEGTAVLTGTVHPEPFTL